MHIGIEIQLIFYLPIENKCIGRNATEGCPDIRDLVFHTSVRIFDFA